MTSFGTSRDSYRWKAPRTLAITSRRRWFGQAESMMPCHSSSFVTTSACSTTSWSNSAARRGEPAPDRAQVVDGAQLEGEALECGHHGSEVLELLGAERDEPEALAVLARDLALALEGDERLAQRGAADAELGGQLHLVDALAGLHVARAHPREQLLANLRAKVLAFDRHLSPSSGPPNRRGKPRA